ncbi:SpaA isopeptide-forming pilin-related protein, partial [Bacillus altitudinis]|uniref:SpaA isopeptide-forming pilin-related protein n=1 Tax=Bacillus altitudinis TaxID=293387 RepID=UPI001C92C2D0
MRKVGEKNDVVEGGELKVVDVNGKEIKRGVVRDEKGKMIVKDVKGGRYEFVERKGRFGHEVEERRVS